MSASKMYVNLSHAWFLNERLYVPQPEPEAVADTVVVSLRLELDHSALVRKPTMHD